MVGGKIQSHAEMSVFARLWKKCGGICSFLEFFLTGGTKRYVHFNVIMVLTQNIGKYVEESCYFCSVLLGVN